jgi:hypothetical protein
MRSAVRFVGIAGVLSLFSLTATGPILADTLVVEPVTNSQRKPLAEIRHDEWNALLAKYVDEDGLVNYTQWKATDSDVTRLNQYLSQLASAELTRTDTAAGRLAFFINAYNAVTIRGILDQYPTTSIRNHTAKLFGFNIWKDLILPVGDSRLSLEDIEHEVLRKMQQPRIHFAIVCASLGCPSLRNEAYTPAKIDQQLENAAKDFFQKPSNFRIDQATNTLAMSSILDWFQEDFGASQADRLERIATWLSPEQAKTLSQLSRPSIEYLDYDWNLNDSQSK